MSKHKKKNSYAKKDEKAHLLQSITHELETKGSIKNSAIETGKDIVLVIVGGLIGSALGKPSLYVGAGVTGAGHYMGNRLGTLLGIGMMAANGFQKSKSVEGLDGMNMQSIKDRMTAYKDNFLEKTYLDKVLHHNAASKSKEETAGFGDLQFFNYPNDVNGPYNELANELSALENIEKQIEDSGMTHMQISGLGMNEFEGVEEFGELADVTDYNL